MLTAQHNLSNASSVMDDRNSERYPCHIEAACHVRAADEQGGAWPARVDNLSRSGIALLLKRRFDLWTLLAIDVTTPEDGSRYTLSARVVHTTELDHGLWLIGCALGQGLSDNEVRFLV